MKNKIKKILSFSVVGFIIILLGLAPVEEEIIFTLNWGDLEIKMTEAGVIDKNKFESLYSQRGGLNEANQKLLSGDGNKNLVITAENSGVMLNLLWAFGLGNKMVR